MVRQVFAGKGAGPTRPVRAVSPWGFRMLVAVPLLFLVVALVTVSLGVELTLRALGPPPLSLEQSLAVNKVRFMLIGFGSAGALVLGLLLALTLATPLRRMVRRARARVEAFGPEPVGPPPVNELAQLSHVLDRALGALDKFMADSRLLDTVPVGVLLVDAQGRVKRSNAEARRLLRLPGESVEGNELRQIAPLEVGQVLARAVRRVRETGAAVQLPPLVAGEGHPPGSELSVVLTPLPSGRPGEILVTLTELSGSLQSQ